MQINKTQYGSGSPRSRSRKKPVNTAQQAKQGITEQRRARMSTRKKYHYYAVATGYRRGIYRLWDNAKKQVRGYSGAVYQGCKTLREAKEFLRDNPLRPLRPTPTPATIPLTQLPVSPDEYVFEDVCREENVRIQVAPPMPRDRFLPVAQMAMRIAENPENNILDPPECYCTTCPYSTGSLMLQRFVLLRRLYQLNVSLQQQHSHVIQDAGGLDPVSPDAGVRYS